MSDLAIDLPAADMEILVEQPTLPDVPVVALWWRLRLLPDEDGHMYYTQRQDHWKDGS